MSFCSIFIIVLSILIVVTIAQKGPIIIFLLAERTTGEYDGVFTSTQSLLMADDYDYDINYVDSGYYLNYTQV